MLRKINRKAKKRGFTLILLFVFFISSQALIFSTPISASVEERAISVEWGDNVFQNLPYTYSGTFYENTDPTDAWDTAKIEFTYIPDSTINDEYPITQDFTNYESKFAHGEQNLTMTEGSYSDFDNVQSNDNNYASFNHTGVGHYNATFSFENELDGTSGTDIEFMDIDDSTGTATSSILSDLDGHKKTLQLDDNTNGGRVDYYHLIGSDEVYGTIEFWLRSSDATFEGTTHFYDGGSLNFGLKIDEDKFQYWNGSWNDIGLGTLDNTWYHIGIDFECTTGSYQGLTQYNWHVYINGLLYGDYGFQNNNPHIDRIRLVTNTADQNYYTYYDAIDYSWDTDYIEGRNREDLDPLGHYPATYSFDDQPVWTSRTDIDYVDDHTSIDEAVIIAEYYEHKKVLKVVENTTGTAHIINNFASGQTSGTIEFFGREISSRGYFSMKDQSNHQIILFQFLLTSIKAFYGDGAGGFVTAEYIFSSSFPHIKIDFDCDTDTQSVWIDDEIIFLNKPFSQDYTSTTVNSIRFGGYDSGHSTELYIDAIGYSFDENYLIGDNINDNYYLGYENFESYNTTNDAEAELEANGWTVDKGSVYNNVSISGAFNSHKKILNLTDDNTGGLITIYNEFSGQTSGTIEFRYRTSDITKKNDLLGYEGASQRIYFYFDGGNIYYYDGAPHDIGDIVNNIWYHFRIDFDCSTDTFDVYQNGILLQAGCAFNAVSTTINRLYIRTDTGDSGYSVYYDAIHYSWEDTGTYFKGSYNQHCNVEAVMDFTVDVPFSYYESFILQVSMDSRYYTNVHTNISWNFYNFTSSSWTEINDYSAITETLREFDDSDVSVGLTGLFDSNGNMKFRYYGYNCSAFYLEIDELTSNIYFGTQFEYEHTLKLLGTWKYRFKLNVTLDNEHITDWIYFNLIEQPPNFEGISESRYSTRWVLTSTATTGELTEVYYDDLTSGYWDLSDFSSRTFDKTVDPEHDSYVSSSNPDTNYGSATDIWVQDLTDTRIIYLGFPSLNYLSVNSTGTYTQIYLYERTYWDPSTSGLFYQTGSFDESTIKWSNKPSDIQYLNTGELAQNGKWYSLNTHIPYQYYSIHSDNQGSGDGDYQFYSYEWTAKYPLLNTRFTKNYHSTSGEGYAYFQVGSTETLGLISSQSSSNTSLSEGDVFTVDLQSTSDNALLKLYSGDILQQTINLLTANTETSRQEVEVIVSEDVSYDQIKITSELDDTEYFKLYDIKAEHWVFESEEDQKIMYVEPYGQNELILNLGNNSLKIYENDILRTDTYITMTYDLTTHIFESPIPETVFVSFYDSNNDYLDFNQFETYVNYTLFEENFVNQRLTNREFYVDEDSTIYFNVYDSFDVNIYSASRLAKTFIDITLSVYTLKIKNEGLDDSSYILTKGSVSKTGILFPDEIDEYKIASGSYTFAYIKGTDPEESIDFTLSGDKLLKINRSQMCFLSYTNQRGEYLNFNQFKTYWNGTLLYENVFYEDIGNNVSIEILDHYDISVKNHSFIVSSGDNYEPVVLTMYSLKVMNQQEVFNHVNITRDPNYYASGYSWSEWIAPTEIIEFNLFAGKYVINLTNYEDGGSSNYEYTLNGDDVILITSGNLLSQVIYNIANVNSTIGNQITAVYINITNQNSNINNTIVSIDINIESMNSTLGNLLTDIDLNIININNNISALYTFTENNFLNLGNNINNSFTLIENNIIAINQTISTLVIGLDGKVTIVNATINTMFTEMNSQFVVVQSTLDFSFAFLNQTIMQIGNNITENKIALQNLIVQRANDIDNSLIQISTLVNLINSSVVNESLVIQSLVNIIGNNITENHVIINDLINLIGNNITENNINMVSLIELVGNNITTNQFVIQTLIDYVSNNITDNHLEFLTNINLINNTIGQNQIELINRLLFINNSINEMALDLTNQILLVNNTIYSAILDVSTSIDFNSDNILGNISLTYEQNDFLTELYKETMFSQLLNWSDVAYNYSLMEDRIDVWEFVNNYKNESIQVFLRYGDLIDNLTITAQNSIEQYLPNEDVEYRLWSIANEEYLTDWVELPENKTVNFGFYEAEIIPEPFDGTILMIVFGAFVIATIGYLILLRTNIQFQKKTFFSVPKKPIKKVNLNKNLTNKSWKKDLESEE